MDRHAGLDPLHPLGDGTRVLVQPNDGADRQSNLPGDGQSRYAARQQPEAALLLRLGLLLLPGGVQKLLDLEYPLPHMLRSLFHSLRWTHWSSPSTRCVMMPTVDLALIANRPTVC